MTKRNLFLKLLRKWLLIIAPSVVLVWALASFAPPRHNPFTPIDLTEKPGLATGFKLAQVQRNPKTCFQALDDAAIFYTPLEDSPPGERCAKTNALTLDRSLTPYSATLSMTCAQTAMLYYWERHIARPAAEELLGTSIARIETFGSFSCRNIAGSGRISQHALANAVDISGFRLEDGRLVDVKTHWNEGGPKDDFLKRVRSGACGLFSVTLGPDYNAAHADHFHFDMGPGRFCR